MVAANAGRSYHAYSCETNAGGEDYLKHVSRCFFALVLGSGKRLHGARIQTLEGGTSSLTSVFLKKCEEAGLTSRGKTVS